MFFKISEEYETKMPSIKEKYADVQILLLDIAEQKRLSEDEVFFIKGLLEEQATVINILKGENFQMREKLPELQPLHQEFASYKQDATETILTLNNKLNETQLKVLDLEKKLTKFGVDIVFLESSKTKELDSLNHQWKDKLKEMDSQFKKIIDELVKKHCEVKKGYETVIHGLKEQIAHKEAEVAWCQLMMRERDTNIDKEIGNLKKELEVASMKNQELLQQRLIEVERRANKMTRKCLKLQQDYEHKITTLKKAKDLQVQALQKHLRFNTEAATDTKENVEDAVKELELRYRKIIINMHTSAQEQKRKDMKRIAELEDVLIGGRTGAEKQ
ncbi:hypothetical protein J6590_004535 [Homalodisca vitripennis]|nr:hypothetical protein J6590_004535 [Homalodisca vitripennis]